MRDTSSGRHRDHWERAIRIGGGGGSTALMAAVVLYAVEDLKSGHPEHAPDALDFLLRRDWLKLWPALDPEQFDTAIDRVCERHYHTRGVVA